MTAVPGRDAEIWWIPTPSLSYAELHAHYGHWLSVDENERLQAQRTPKGCYAFLLTRVALRAVLSLRMPGVTPAQWQFQRTARGRPAIAGVANAPDFNLSHADDALVITLASHGKLGVDVESLGREIGDMDRLAQRYFHPEEARALLALPVERQRSRFLTLWTLKEACLKATGQGLANSLQEFHFLLEDPPLLQCPRFEQDRMLGRRVDAGRGPWRAWSGVLMGATPGACRLSLVWQLMSVDLAREAGVSVQRLLFPEQPATTPQAFVREPISQGWEWDWIYR